MEATGIPAGESMKRLWKYHHNGILTFIVPLILLPIWLVGKTPAYRCLYVITIMVIFFVTNCLHYMGTSLIPVVGFPLLGIMSSSDVSRAFLTEGAVVFFGSCFVGLAMESSGLPRHMGIWVLNIVGSNPKVILITLIILSALLSHVVPCTMAAAMVASVAKSVLEDLDEAGIAKAHNELSADDAAEVISTDEEIEPSPSNCALAFYLGIAWGSAIGGLCSLPATEANVFLKEYWDGFGALSDEKITYSKIFFYAIAVVITLLIILFLYLCIVYLGMCRPNSEAAQGINPGEVGAVLEERKKDLGDVNVYQVQVLLVCLLTIVLIATQRPIFVTGWADKFPDKKVGIGVSCLIIILVLFAFPINYMCCRILIRSKPYPTKFTPSLILWKFFNKYMPWQFLWMFGGVLTMARGIQSSGLATLFSDYVSGMAYWSPKLTQFIFITFAMLGTSILPNPMVVSLLGPIATQIAVQAGLHPLYFLIPITFSASLPFFFPVSNGPNAIVAGLHFVRQIQMGIGAIIPSILAIVVIFLESQILYSSLIKENTIRPNTTTVSPSKAPSP